MDTNFPVLVVDDDKIPRNVVRNYLKKAGFNVTTAENGKEALEKFDEQFFPVILTDWMMPEIDGPQLCKLIREKKTSGYVYIILITAKDAKNDIVSGLEAGADDYLTKPIHQPELMARIYTGLRILELEQSLVKANQEIHQLSITDPLTGCFNRGYLAERFPQELQRAIRYHLPLSVIIADIDFFKKVNDTYGHHAGDEVLKNFANAINNGIRKKIDWIVRYGGEEFLIILPETSCEGAIITAERLRVIVSNTPTQVDNQTINVTSSFGGTSTIFVKEPKGDEIISMEHLVNFADAQLYKSKEEGRNKVNILEFSR